MTLSNQHCLPKQPGESFPAYFKRHKTFLTRRENELDAVRRARLPTPADSDTYGYTSDSDVDTFDPPAITTAPSPASPAPRPLNIHHPDFNVTMLDADKWLPSTRSPTDETGSSGPQSYHHLTATRSALSSIIHSRGALSRQPLKGTLRQPFSPKQSHHGGVHKTSPARQLRSRTRLSQAASQFFELDSQGRPRLAQPKGGAP